MAEHPFYVRQTAEPEHTQSHESRQDWFRAAVDEARAEGAKSARMSVREEPVPMLLVEAWAERPDDEGPQRWALQ